MFRNDTRKMDRSWFENPIGQLVLSVVGTRVLMSSPFVICQCLYINVVDNDTSFLHFFPSLFFEGISLWWDLKLPTHRQPTSYPSVTFLWLRLRSLSFRSRITYISHPSFIWLYFIFSFCTLCDVFQRNLVWFVKTKIRF